MKTKYIIIIISVCLASCEGILDVSPTQSLDVETAIATEKDLLNGIIGCYDAMQSSGYYGRSFINVGDLASDNAYNGGTIKEYGQINNNNVLEDNYLIEGIWNSIYDAINKSNDILLRIDNIDDLTQDEKDSYAAELRFLRALHYFNLVKTFGEVPLKLQPTSGLDNLNTPVSSVNNIYSAIMDDLDFADGKIINTSKVRGTNMAVKALKAKVHLYRGDYDDAVSECDYIIDNGACSLLSDFVNLYLTEENSESIFEVSFDDQDKNRLAEYFFPNPLTGRYEVAPTTEFIESFEDNDLRSDATIQVAGDYPYVNKYEEISTGGDNVYVFRLAEIYLLRAEALAMLEQDFNDALSDINTIRTRAGLSDTPASDYDELLLAIENERRHEFAFEGQRWFDLVRTDRAYDILPTVTSTDQYLFPIPLAETSTNEAIN